MFVLTLTSIVIAYLLGSMLSGVILCRLTHQPDPRTQGSDNPGATNVLRFAGKKIAFLTLLGDIIKGLLAIMIARLLGQSGCMLAFVGLAVLIGHLYPIFFKFKGGKGISTGLGVLLGLSPVLGLIAMMTWIIIAAVFRYSSLAALVTFALMPFYNLVFFTPAYFIPLVLMSCLIFWRHRANIKRLHAGTESKINF